MVDRIDLPAIIRMIERESQMGDEEREEVMGKAEGECVKLQIDLREVRL